MVCLLLLKVVLNFLLYSYSPEVNTRLFKLQPGVHGLVIKGKEVGCNSTEVRKYEGTRIIITVRRPASGTAVYKVECMPVCLWAIQVSIILHEIRERCFDNDKLIYQLA